MNQKKRIVFSVIKYGVLATFLFLVLYPFYHVLIASFSSGIDYTYGGIVWWPRRFSLENYMIVLNDKRLYSALLVTFARVIIGTITAIFFTSMVSYAMSRKELKYKRTFYGLSLVAMFFSSGIIPYFLVIKSIGLFDNFLVYIIPNMYNVFHMLVLSRFFKQIPEEYHDAASMDGASEFRIWLKIYMPLSKPIISTISLWIAINQWSSYYDTMLFTNRESLHTLQYYLIKIIKEASLPPIANIQLPPDVIDYISPITVQFAAIVISIIPVILFYPLISRVIIKGLQEGSLAFN